MVIEMTIIDNHMDVIMTESMIRFIFEQIIN